MKKLFLAAMAVLGLSIAGMAQTKAPAKKTSEKKTHITAPAKSEAVAPASAKSEKVAKESKATHHEAKNEVAKTKAANGTKLKADGTPDKRYKENKKLKADGTADMRYKENKQKASKTEATKAKETKKSGK